MQVLSKQAEYEVSTLVGIPSREEADCIVQWQGRKEGGAHISATSVPLQPLAWR